MLLSPRKDGLDSLFKEVRVFKAIVWFWPLHRDFHRKMMKFVGNCGRLLTSTLSPHFRAPFYPEGPNLEKFQDRPPGLKFSSEIETSDIFKRD